MDRVLAFLEGKKTYIVAVTMVLVTYLVSKGWMGQAEYELVYGVLVALGLASLRMAVNK